ncbi:MAG: hypothetical protein JNL80_11445 [Phycisphaerae bacterium]|jgi:hypothetical protein|nr:hypothetical protein [Phycisphaerae bacterium]
MDLAATARRSLCTLLLTAGISAQATAAEKTWDGGGGNLSWNNAANWNPDGLPTAADDVIINILGSTETISIPSGTALCNTLSSSENITVSGTLNVASPSTINGLITVTGTLTGTGDLVLNGGLTLSTGVLSGASTVTIPAGATIAFTTSTNAITSRSVLIAGTALWSAAQLNMSNASIQVLPGGVFHADAPAAALVQASGTNAFINDGTLVKSSASSSITVPLTNNGAIQVNGGTLTLAGSGANNGSIEVNAGGTLSVAIARTWSVGSLLGGSGQIVFNSGTQVFPADTFAPNGSFLVNSGTNVTLNSAFAPATLASPVAGTLNLQADQTFPAVTVTGTLTGTGDFTFPSGLTLSSGNLSGEAAALIPVGATLTFDTNTNSIASRDIDVAGEIQWNAGQVNCSNVTLHVLPDAVFHANASSTLAVATGANLLLNEGTILKSSGAGTIGIPFTNDGVVQIDGGSLTISGSGSNSGSLHVAAGATLYFLTSRTWNAGSTLGGAGAIVFTSGSQVFPSGAFTPAGSFQINSSANVTLNAGFAPDTLASPVAGTLSVNVDQSFPAVTVTGTLAGSGNFVFPSGLTLAGGALSGAATATIPSGATLFFHTSTNSVVSRSIDVAGEVVWSAAQINFNSSSMHILPAGVFHVEAPSVLAVSAGVNTIVNDGTIAKSAASSSINVALTNNASIDLDGGSLTLNGSGTNNGIIDVGAGATLVVNSTRTWAPGSALTGPGLIQFNNGTQSFPSGTFAPSGTFSVLSGSTVTLNNGFPVAALLSPLAGTLNVNASQTFPALTVTGALGGTGDQLFPNGLTLAGANLNGAATTTIPAGATLTLGTTPNLISGRTVDVGGEVQWTGAQINFQNASMHILPGGVFHASASATFAIAAGTNTFLNEGTFDKSSGVTTMSVPFTNAGTMSVTGGSIAVTGSYTQTAGATLITGGSFTKTSGSVALQGGVLGGTGTLTGSVSQTGGTIAPGLSPGQFTITGTVTQNATSTLDIELGGLTPGSQHDRLVGNGTITAAGTLRLSFVDGFVPHGGDSFTVATAATLNGGYTSVDVLGYPDCVASAAKVGNTIVVTIESVPPTALCKNIDVNLSAAGNATITPAMIDNGSSDNCEVASLELDTSSFTCADLGPNMVTLTVRDHAQNSSTCQAIVTVHDVTAPVIIGFPDDASLGCPSQIPAPNTSLVTATDACGPITITHQGDAGNGGAGCAASPLVVTRTYRATDGSGNFAEETQIFLVIDVTAPSFVGFPANQSLGCPGDVPPANPGALTATDGCGGGVAITHVGDVSNGGNGCPESPLVVTRTYRATDACGNATTQAQVFTVIDSADPTIDSFPADATLECIGDLPAPDTALVVASDTCDPAVVVTHEGDTFNGGSGCVASPLLVSRTYRAADACGHAIERVQTFTVIDLSAPEITSPPPGGSAQAECGTAVLPDLRETLSAVDNCLEPTVLQSPTPGTLLGIGNHVITFSVSDACDNVTVTTAEYVVSSDTCVADVNNNGIVDATDLALVLGAWGACPGCCANISGGENVDAVDVAILLGAWGPCPGGDQQAASEALNGKDGSSMADRIDGRETTPAPTTGAAPGTRGDPRGSGAATDDHSSASPTPLPTPGDSAVPTPRVIRADERTGLLLIDGDLLLESCDRVVIRVSEGRSDLIIVTGIAQLAGTLVIEHLDPPHDPIADAMYRTTLCIPVLAANELRGAFEAVTEQEGDGTPVPLDSSRLRTTAQVCSVYLTRPLDEDAAPPAPVDIDGDGFTGVFDLVVMFQAMGRDSDDLARRADLDADGAITTADLVEQARRLGFAARLP